MTRPAPKPGDTVDFTLTFRGKVVKVRDVWVTIRTSKGVHQILRSDVKRIIDPTPDESEVIRTVTCPGCHSAIGSPCGHKQKQPRTPVRHPHKERIEFYIETTGWTPDGNTNT